MVQIHKKDNVVITLTTQEACAVIYSLRQQFPDSAGGTGNYTEEELIDSAQDVLISLENNFSNPI